MATNKTDRSFKTLINKRTTSEDKRSFEEFGDRTINVHSSEIWADDIADNDPAQAVIDGAAELRTLFTLTKDTTVGGDQTWYAEDTGVRLKDWISDKFGADYTVHIFDDFNNEIFPTHESDWFFDYQTGILTFSGDTSGLDKPFRITGYRYIGTKGGGGGGGVTGPGTSTDHAIPRYDGTGGDTLLNSGVTLSDTDAMVFPAGGSISKPGAGASSEAFGAGASAGSGESVALGNGASISATAAQQSVAVGQLALVDPDSNGSVAVGKGAWARDMDAICIGRNATVRNPSTGDNHGSIAIGRDSVAGASGAAGASAAIALGLGTSVLAGATDSVAIGAGVTINATSPNGIAIGAGADISANSSDCTVIGQGATVTFGADSATVLGQGATCSNSNGTALGVGSSAGFNSVSLGASSVAAESNVTAVGATASCSSLGGVALGVGASVASGANDAISIGADAFVRSVSSGESDGAICIGHDSEIGNATPGAGCNAAICIGENSSIGAGATDAVAIGPAASAGAGAVDSVVVGSGASATGTSAVSIGPGCTSTANDTVVVGDGCNITGASNFAIAIGNNVDLLNAADSIAIGRGMAITTSSGFVAMGAGASLTASSDAVVIGVGATAEGSRAIALGYTAWAKASNAVALGREARVHVPTSGANTSAIAIGTGASVGSAAGAGCDAAICIGQSAVVNVASADSIAIGAAASVGASSGQSTVVGPSASTTSNLASVFGYNASAEAGNTVAMGASSVAGETQSIAIGRDAKVHNVTTGDSSRAVVIGYGSQVASDAGTGCDAATVVGSSSHAHDGALNATLVGFNVDSFGADTVVMGNGANVRSAGSGDSTGSIAIGAGSDIGTSAGAGCDAAICIGENSSVGAGHSNAVVIGQSGASTASNRVTFASTLEVEVGQGLAVWGATPPGSQPAKISDPTGGTTVDSESRTAIQAIIDVLEGAGLSAT